MGGAGCSTEWVGLDAAQGGWGLMQWDWMQHRVGGAGCSTEWVGLDAAQSG